MLLHALVTHLSVTLSSTFEHLVRGSNLPVGLGHNRNMNENKSIFICAPVELSHSRNMILELLTLRWGNVVVVVFKDIGVGIVDEFPVVKTVSIGVLKEGLAIADSVYYFLHWHGQLFR